jgi:ribosomal protein S18 acetylase RimI-like enzyme
MSQDDVPLTIRQSHGPDMPVLIDFMRDVARMETLRGNLRMGDLINDQSITLLEKCVSFLAIIHAEIVGAASILLPVSHDVEDQPRARFALLFLIAVKEDWRNQGIGRRLMQTALSWCKDEQIDNITLTVKTANEGAIRFYRSFGFDSAALTMHRRIDFD